MQSDIKINILGPDGLTHQVDYVFVDDKETETLYKEGKIPFENVVVLAGEEDFSTGSVARIFGSAESKNTFYGHIAEPKL